MDDCQRGSGTVDERASDRGLAPDAADQQALASAAVSLNHDVIAILEEQLQAHLRTVRLLGAVVAGHESSAAVHPESTGRVGAAVASDDAWSALERRRKQLEHEGAELLSRSAEHAARLRQFEQDISDGFNAIMAEVFRGFQGDYKSAIDRAESIVRVLEQAGASIAELNSASQSAAMPPVQQARREPPSAEPPSPATTHAPPPPVPASQQQDSQEAALDVVDQAEPTATIQSEGRSDVAPGQPLSIEYATDDPQCRRTTHRLKVESLESNLGTVVDLSRGGARILCSKPLEGEVAFEISASDVTFAVTATVAWCERQTWRHYAAGIQFPELSDEQGQKLTRICMETRKQTTMTA